MAVGAGYRNYFTSPVRLGQGLQVASGRNASASNVIVTNGDIVDTSSNIVFDYSAREIAVSGLTVGASGTDTKITALRVYSATIGSGSIAGSSIVQSSYTVTGLTTSDKILTILPPASGISSGGAASLMGFAYYFVSAADTLAIAWWNANPNANVHVTGTYTIVALRS